MEENGTHYYYYGIALVTTVRIFIFIAGANVAFFFFFFLSFISFVNLIIINFDWNVRICQRQKQTIEMSKCEQQRSVLPQPHGTRHTLVFGGVKSSRCVVFYS